MLELIWILLTYPDSELEQESELRFALAVPQRLW